MDSDEQIAANLQSEEWASADVAPVSQPLSSGKFLSATTSSASSGPRVDADAGTGWSLPVSARAVLGAVCHSSLEVSDPAPDARSLFLEFNAHVFHGKLDGVELRWSKTMTSCAGVCSYEGKGGLCSVRLSEPLLKLRPRADLVNTLLHEMIHAWEFVAARRRDHDAHGKEFLRIAAAVNEALGSNVTVYHTFHDEVASYQRHVWQCSGPCKARSPYFGLVKRAMNRPPGPSDWWFERHRVECGGAYTKIAAPDPEEKKKARKRALNEKESEQAKKRGRGCRRIEDMIQRGEGGTGGAGGSASVLHSLSSSEVVSEVVLLDETEYEDREGEAGDDVVDLLDEEDDDGLGQGAGAVEALSAGALATTGYTGAGAGAAVDLEEEDVILVSPQRRAHPYT